MEENNSANNIKTNEISTDPRATGNQKANPRSAARQSTTLHLTAQQMEAVKTVYGPVLLLAVPGSGKTTVLVLRLGYMIKNCGIAPENILTVTYTVAATRDMNRRFAQFYGDELASRLEFRTINGICAKIIAFYSRAVGKKPFELVTDEKKTAGILSQIYHEVQREWPTEADLRSVRTMITYIKNRMLSDGEIREMAEKNAGMSWDTGSDLRIDKIYGKYNSWLRQQHLMDYDDQMVYAYTILRKVPQVLKYFQEQYRYICVDEAQDTSKIQHAIIALLAGKYSNLFMVGDEDQSIYGFRAAYPEALLHFEQEHKGAKILLMEENFRSGSDIVSAADRFIKKNKMRHAKNMVCAEGAQEGPGIKEIALKGRKAQFTYMAKVADRCAQDREKGRTDVTAVLYRNNESAIPLVDLLERNGTPYRIRNAELGFFTHRVVMDIKNVIKLAYAPEDVEAFAAVYYKLGMYLSKDTAMQICDVSRRMGISVFDAALRYVDLEPKVVGNVRAVRTHMENMKDDNGDQAVARICKFMGYGEFLKKSKIRDDKIYILKALGAKTESPAELVERLEFLEDIFRNRESDPGSTFVLSTIHASKGLEYDNVYLMDVFDGQFPEEVPISIKYMNKEESRAFEEERRLFYVGMTRARKKLSVFTTGAKSILTDELFGREYVERSAEQAAGQTSYSRSGTGVKKPGAAYAGTKGADKKRLPRRKLKASVRRSHLEDTGGWQE